LRLICNAHIDEKTSADRAYERAKADLKTTLAKLREPRVLEPIDAEAAVKLPFPASNTTRPEFESMVTKAKELITAGDVFQVVLSQRFETDFVGDPLDLYRALRFGNPSPYMFCLRLGRDFAVLGSSPEIHLRVRERAAELRPIAGTYPRGKDLAEDEQLASALIVDPKERAEHVMLIDLGRNDLGRVAEFGSVRV